MLITGPSKTSGKRNKRKKDVIKDAHGNDDLQKKMRTTFTGAQVFELENSFESKKYLSSAQRGELAASLDVTQQQVRAFQVLSSIPCHIDISDLF